MAGFSDYEAYDAVGLADLVRRRKVTPTELLDAAIERVEARNPTVNAVVLPALRLRAEGDRRRLARRAAPRRAVSPQGPHRVARGGPTMRGSRFFADTPPAAADSEHVAPPEAGRAGRVRAHEHVRARALPDLRAAALRPHAEPVGPDPDLRRLERRRGGGRPARASFRSPTRATDSGRSGRPPPAAASSGSSRLAAGTRWRRTRARASAGSRRSTP